MSRDFPSLRVDKWLWFARFFKSRALAAQALRGGKVRIAGARIKSARELRVGEVLEITRGIERFEVCVMELGQRRGPASEAQRLYQETEASKARRAAMQAAHDAAKSSQLCSDHKPNKRERRQLERFRRR